MIDVATTALPRTFRALPLASIGVIGVVAVVPTVLTVAREGDDLAMALTIAAVVGGAGFAYAVDDDAAQVLAASPSPPSIRRATRVVAAALLIGGSWAAVLGMGWSTGLSTARPLADLALEAVTAAGVGIAVAAWLRPDHAPERTGLAGAASAVVLMLLITSLALRYPWLPSLGQPQNHDRWWWVAAVAWAGVWWTVRDPAARRPGRCDV